MPKRIIPDEISNDGISDNVTNSDESKRDDEAVMSESNSSNDTDSNGSGRNEDGALYNKKGQANLGEDNNKDDIVSREVLKLMDKIPFGAVNDNTLRYPNTMD